MCPVHKKLLEKLFQRAEPRASPPRINAIPTRSGDGHAKDRGSHRNGLHSRIDGHPHLAPYSADSPKPFHLRADEKEGLRTGRAPRGRKPPHKGKPVARRGRKARGLGTSRDG